MTSSPLAFAALRHRDYRRYFVTGLTSMLADSIEHVISYWVIFQVFRSPALAGFAVISHWVPFLLFSVPMGALADRLDCRKLIQISQALYVIASLSWGVLVLTDTLAMWHAVVILLIHGMAGVIVAPAAQLIIHDMVGREHLHSAVRLNASSRHLAILLGPAVGGAMMVALGPGWAIVLNVLLYLPLTVFLLRVPYTGHRTDGVRSGFGFGLAETARLLDVIRGDRRIVTTIALGGVASFFVGNAFQAQMPEYAQRLGTDEAGLHYSLLLAANAGGAVLGAALMETFRVLEPRVRTVIVCAAVWAALMALFPLLSSYALAVVVLTLAGMFNIAFTAMAQTIVQLFAPAAVRGRVVGFFNTATLGLRFGSGITVGLLGALTTVHLSLALSAAVVFVVSLALLTVDAEQPAA